QFPIKRTLLVHLVKSSCSFFAQAGVFHRYYPKSSFVDFVQNCANVVFFNCIRLDHCKSSVCNHSIFFAKVRIDTYLNFKNSLFLSCVFFLKASMFDKPQNKAANNKKSKGKKKDCILVQCIWFDFWKRF